jgi:uncharacterized protein (TIGR02391 family)
LADTVDGLTGSEIGRLLEQSRIKDSDPTMTKWKRLYNALAASQQSAASGTPVLNFIHHGLAPARYVGQPLVFEHRRSVVNVTLAFLGLRFEENGKFRSVAAASTLNDAEERASRLRAILHARGVHPDVLRFCRAELLQDNYFHAVLEATKSVAEKLRRRSGLATDGSELVDQTLSGPDPILRLNSLSSQSEKSEQSGFVNLLKGLFGVFRNPMSHAPRASWPIAEIDALDLLSLASYSHRRIDASTKRS